jgi:superfamily II DNA or RNA helicase
MLDKKKDEVQQKALTAWIKAGKVGTAEIATGIGKTFLALHALYTMPKHDGKLHLFLAETIDRERDLKQDILLYNQIFKRDVFYDYNLEFHCYQTVFRWTGFNFGLIIADEIHDSLSEAYSMFYKHNTYDAILGLSAKIDRSTRYVIDNIVITKGELLDKVAPIIFKYSLKDGLQEGLSRRLNIHIIFHKLDDKLKTVKAGSIKKPFYQTEKASYEYWNSQHVLAWHELNQDEKERKIRMTSHKRSRLLFELPSKVEAVKKILTKITGPTILFGNSIHSLKKVTPNVITSKLKQEENDKIRDNFEKGIIWLIGAFKKLKQGANLSNLDNVILMSYYSTEKDIIQRLGRLRMNEDKNGEVFILLTKDTQEEIWFRKMMIGTDHYNKTYYEDINEFLEKYEYRSQ